MIRWWVRDPMFEMRWMTVARAAGNMTRVRVCVHLKHQLFAEFGASYDLSIFQFPLAYSVCCSFRKSTHFSIMVNSYSAAYTMPAT